MRIRNRSIVLFIVIAFLLAALAAAGCLGVRAPSVTRPTPPAIMLDFHRTGGIAGLDDRLVIFDNGAAIFSSRSVSRELSLNQSDLNRIAALFSAAQFSSLQGNYTLRHEGADLIHYSVTYQGKTVNTEDSAVPPSLQVILDRMNLVIRDASIAESSNQPFASLMQQT